MKKTITYFTTIAVLLIGLTYMIVIYFNSDFDSEDLDLTFNLNQTDNYQGIYIDKVFGVTKLVSAKVIEIDTPDQRTGMANLKKVRLKTVKLSGKGSPKIYHAQFDGKELHIFFSPIKGKDEFDVLLSPNPLPININGNYRIPVRGHNWSDIVKMKDFLSNCRDSFDEEGLIDENTLIDKDCLDFMSEEGRICNLNCVHE